MEPPPLKRQKLDINEDHEGIAPFDMLPSEMAEIPIKMAMKTMKTQERYDFLVDVLPYQGDSERLQIISLCGRFFTL